jgi:hypothetical protein
MTDDQFNALVNETTAVRLVLLRLMARLSEADLASLSDDISAELAFAEDVASQEMPAMESRFSRLRPCVDALFARALQIRRGEVDQG